MRPNKITIKRKEEDNQNLFLALGDYIIQTDPQLRILVHITDRWKGRLSTSQSA